MRSNSRLPAAACWDHEYPSAFIGRPWPVPAGQHRCDLSGIPLSFGPKIGRRRDLGVICQCGNEGPPWPGGRRKARELVTQTTTTTTTTTDSTSRPLGNAMPAARPAPVSSAAWHSRAQCGLVAAPVRLYKTATAPATPPRNRRCTAAPTVPLHPPPCTGSDTRRRQTRPVHTNSAHATWARGSVGPDEVTNLRYSQLLIPCVLARAKSWKVHADAGLQHGVVAG